MVDLHVSVIAACVGCVLCVLVGVVKWICGCADVLSLSFGAPSARNVSGVLELPFSAHQKMREQDRMYVAMVPA